MKKVIFAVAALGLIAFSSCKKKYTCTCTVAGVSADTTSAIKMKKSEAETWCNTYNALAAFSGGSCKLK